MFKFTSVATAAAMLAAAWVVMEPGGAPSASAAQAAATAENVKYNRYYEIRKDNRIYVFAEHQFYEAFKSSGELAYVRTKIGAGPNRETIVYAINSDQAKLPLTTPTLPEILYADLANTLGGDDFFAILERDNRYYVSSDVGEFLNFHMSGEAAYARSKIGGGPNRKTLVVVHTKDEVGKPLTRVEQLAEQKLR